MPPKGLPAGKRKTKLLPKEHSGRLRPHHHTSYGSLLLVLVLAFSLVLFVQRSASAGVGDTSGSGNYQGYGVVPHLPITTAPAITSLPSGEVRTTNDSLQVSGTCPGSSIVHIYKNNVLAATPQCQGGTFSASVDLFIGANTLIARAYNADNLPGPDSAPVLVTLSVPGLAPAAAPTGNSAAAPFYVTADNLYQTAAPGKAVQWKLSANGGQSPYKLQVNWGDGKASTLTLSSAGTYALAHRYAASASGAQYNVDVTATDQQNDSALLQLTALLPVTAGTVATSTSLGGGRVTTIWAALGLAIVTVTVISFWIGEKRELLLLAHRVGRFA